MSPIADQPRNLNENPVNTLAKYARWHHADDRFQFEKWLQAPGPRGKRYASLHPDLGTLYLRLSKPGFVAEQLLDSNLEANYGRHAVYFAQPKKYLIAEIFAEVVLSRNDLHLHGFRKVVAQRLREMRHYLKTRREVQLFTA